MQEQNNNRIIGEFRDIITYPDGTVEDRGWNRNTIVVSVNQLISALLKKETGYTGIQYWAIGSGQPEWDSSQPNAQPTDRGCVNEFFRKAITPTAIRFVDEAGQTTSAVTNRLEISLFFDKNEAVGSWREFSIIGGNATASLNTGYSINHKIHGKIEKTRDITIERTIRFTFN